jgi:hypothetical protein
MYRKYESKARVNGKVYKVLKVAVENSEDGAVYWGEIPLTRDKFSPELVIQDKVYEFIWNSRNEVPLI